MNEETLINQEDQVEEKTDPRGKPNTSNQRQDRQRSDHFARKRRHTNKDLLELKSEFQDRKNKKTMKRVKKYVDNARRQNDPDAMIRSKKQMKKLKKLQQLNFEAMKEAEKKARKDIRKKRNVKKAA